MDAKKLDYFKTKLLRAKQDILNGSILNNLDDVQIDAEELSDEADIASTTTTQQITFSIRERELNKLKRIDAALNRIDTGTFGICEESGEYIEIKRLENQPWTEYCIEIAEEKEREESQRFRRAN